MGVSRLPRLKDVAKEAKVSLAAASIILRNGKGRFQKETCERVLEAARKLGWRRNLLVRGMQTGRTRTAGVLVPPINSYWADVLFGIHHELAQKDYLPVTVWTSSSREFFHKTQPKDIGLTQISRLIDQRVDGLILWRPFAVTYNDNFSDLIRKNIQVVVIDSDFPGNIVDSVGTDEELGGRLVAEHIVGLGHRRIACLSKYETMEDRTWAVRRRKSFENVLSKYPDVSYRLWQAALDGSDSIDVARKLLREKSRPTAIFTFSDYEAVSVYTAALEMGLRIPDDLSVVGFSDLVFAKSINPPLTTVQQRPWEIGQKSVKVLIDRLEGKIKDKKPVNIRVGCNLVLRNSTTQVSS